ncbi:MAG TPA: hypothetical protein VN282_14170 [Pyrinomonadaceae bacterium]|nr:hypothetical protein [Pyrinomonadaceae bacterium]
MSEEVQPGTARSTPVVRRFVIYGVVLLVAFLLGLVPMWLKARRHAGSLAAAERQLTLIGMQHSLASAAIDARRGEYEPARRAASQFFTSARAEIDEGEASALTQAQRQGVAPLLAERDELITLLARGDPASADRLSELYVKYRAASGQPPR